MKHLAPRAERTKQPLLEALARALPARGRVLELASGTGQHVAHFARALPTLVWQPSELGPAARASIDAWCDGLANVRPAIALDATAAWPAQLAPDAVIALDLVHLLPRTGLDHVLAEAARVLPPGGVLCLYGPVRPHAQPRPPPPRASLAGWIAHIDPPSLPELEAAAARTSALELVEAAPLVDPTCRIVVLRTRSPL